MKCYHCDKAATLKKLIITNEDNSKKEIEVYFFDEDLAFRLFNKDHTYNYLCDKCMKELGLFI